MTAAARKLAPAEPPEPARADSLGGAGFATPPEGAHGAPKPETRASDSPAGAAGQSEKRATAAERTRRSRGLVAAGLVLAKPEIPVKLLGDLYTLGAIAADCLPESKRFDRVALGRAIVEMLREYARHLAAKERERSKRQIAKL